MSSNAAQGAGGLLKLAQRAFAGDGFDAPHAGGDAAFIDDLADADIAGAAHVRAAAQLLAETGHGDHAHLLAVFFAEQRHGAGGDGLIERHDVGVDLGVAEDLLVHEPLDFFDFGAVHGGVVGEIEAQAAGLHHAAGLLDVRAQHLAQRGVQQMRGGVIAAWWRRAAARPLRRAARRPREMGACVAMRCTVRPGTPGEGGFDVGHFFARSRSTARRGRPPGRRFRRRTASGRAPARRRAPAGTRSTGSLSTSRPITRDVGFAVRS